MTDKTIMTTHRATIASVQVIRSRWGLIAGKEGCLETLNGVDGGMDRSAESHQAEP